MKTILAMLAALGILIVEGTIIGVLVAFVSNWFYILIIPVAVLGTYLQLKYFFKTKPKEVQENVLQ